MNNRFTSTFIIAISVILSQFTLACDITKEAETRIEKRAKDILAQMTLEEKIGQIIQADISTVTPEDVATYNLGSVLNGGNSAPNGQKTAPPQEWIALADKYWHASTDKSDGGVGIPLLWGTDAVHGHNNLQMATIFPHNSGLGAMHNAELMEQIGRVTATEVRATGLDWTFAPTLAVARDDRWGRAYESYSEDPELVAAYAAAMVKGLQGESGADDFLRGEHLIATAKHFIADGGTAYGIDKGDTQIASQDDLMAIHGLGYITAIDADVQTVMASFSSVNGEKMHGSYSLLTGLLRDELGFKGFVIGDWNGHAEIPSCTATNCPQALMAGVDMYMAPDSWKGLYQSLLAQAQSGTIPQARLDEAVLRILKVKIRNGLLDQPSPSQRVTSNIDKLGTDAHREIAREAVRQSLVLLKNNNSILPLRPQQKILLAGSGAHSMQQQTGGWTLSWQGNDNKNEDFETGQTIYEGIKDYVEANGGQVILAEDGITDQPADIAIIVYGEQPYAEYKGDLTDLVFEFETGENLELLKSIKQKNIPVISIFLTGRPLWVNPHINQSDAFVVAWLPGTEGGGIADVIFAAQEGEVRHEVSGRLSFSWPKNGKGEPINGQDDDNTLFAYGYGMNYGEARNMPLLAEASGVFSSQQKFSGLLLEYGKAVKPLTLFLGDSSNTRVPTPTLKGQSISGAIKTTATDYKAQEDTRLIDWTGTDRAMLSLSAQRALDFTDIGAINSLVLAVSWKIDDLFEDMENAHIAMYCGEGCGGKLSLSSIFGSQQIKAGWHEHQIPVRCFVSNGLDPQNVTTPFQISGDGAARIKLHKVEIKSVSKPPACP